MGLHRLEEGLQVEAGKDDDTVAAVGPRVRDDNQRVYVAEGQEPHHRLGLYAQFLARLRVVKPDLGRIGDDVAVGYHDCFRKPRSAARVAQERNLPRALSLDPVQLVDVAQLPPLVDQVLHRGKAAGLLNARDLEDEDPLVGDARALGGL